MAGRASAGVENPLAIGEIGLVIGKFARGEAIRSGQKPREGGTQNDKYRDDERRAPHDLIG
jgi:hypothetical protein